MTRLAERSVDVVQRRLSRRGLLALCGRLAAGLGLAMLGVAGTSRRALADCCPGPTCDAHTHPCPSSGCPMGCIFVNSSQCCDASGFIHVCWQCFCSPITCYCEEPTHEPC